MRLRGGSAAEADALVAALVAGSLPGDASAADRAIHDICAITAYFAFVNRIADGLGVELEAGGRGGL